MRSEGTRQSTWVLLIIKQFIVLMYVGPGFNLGNNDQKNIRASALALVRLIGRWNPCQE
ncbi:MAG: hypothetical protein PHV06_08415 [bacterium]|nr:hypothetical protein [bacterium]